ncbi:unnamed protein product [Absidia cylindrospora]
MSLLRPLQILPSLSLRGATAKQAPLFLTQIRTQATAVTDKNGKSSKLSELKAKLAAEDAAAGLDDFVNPGYEKLTPSEAMELRETVVEGKKVMTTKL